MQRPVLILRHASRAPQAETLQVQLTIPQDTQTIDLTFPYYTKLNLVNDIIMDHSHMNHGDMGHDMPGMDHGHQCNMNVRSSSHTPTYAQS
jgi:hypothetical protein